MLPLLFLAACSSNDDAFDKSPSQRSSESIAALKEELVNAPHGWRVISVVLQSVRTDTP